MAENISKDTEEKIGQLQLLEQSMQNLSVQKQNFQAQLLEIDSAIKELNETDKAYKIIGNIMVASNKEDLGADLKSKKEMFEIRIKTIEKQEKNIKDKAAAMQEEVMKQLQAKK